MQANTSAQDIIGYSQTPFPKKLHAVGSEQMSCANTEDGSKTAAHSSIALSQRLTDWGIGFSCISVKVLLMEILLADRLHSFQRFHERADVLIAEVVLAIRRKMVLVEGSEDLVVQGIIDVAGHEAARRLHLDVVEVDLG